MTKKHIDRVPQFVRVGSGSRLEQGIVHLCCRNDSPEILVCGGAEKFELIRRIRVEPDIV
jgi:hypothetical protein